MRKPMKQKMTDVKFIQSPMEWPRWPLLPLVRRKGAGPDRDDRCGFIVSVEAPPYTVYIGYIFGLKSGVALGEAVEALPSEEYATAEALLAEWRID